MMVSGNITKDGLCKSNVDLCGICSLRVEANSVLYVHCGKLIHGRCAGVKRASKFYRNFACRKCEENVFLKQWIRKKCYVMKWKQ